MSRGGIRFRAGRPRQRLRREGCKRINVHRLKYLGKLRPWNRFHMDGVEFYVDGLYVLDIRHRGVQTVVNIERVQRPICGERIYLACPRCCRRSRDLYAPPQSAMWGCRVCLDLSYDVESMTKIDKLQEKIAALQRRLAQPRLRQKTRTRLEWLMSNKRTEALDLILAAVKS